MCALDPSSKRSLCQTLGALRSGRPLRRRRRGDPLLRGHSRDQHANRRAHPDRKQGVRPTGSARRKQRPAEVEDRAATIHYAATRPATRCQWRSRSRTRVTTISARAVPLGATRVPTPRRDAAAAPPPPAARRRRRLRPPVPPGERREAAVGEARRAEEKVAATSSSASAGRRAGRGGPRPRRRRPATSPVLFPPMICDHRGTAGAGRLGRRGADLPALAPRRPAGFAARGRTRKRDPPGMRRPTGGHVHEPKRSRNPIGGTKNSVPVTARLKSSSRSWLPGGWPTNMFSSIRSIRRGERA